MDFEIKVLIKGLSFIPTPEKVYRLQVKKDLEKPLKVSSNWTIYINEIQLGMYLPEIEDMKFLTSFKKHVITRT